MATEDGMVDPTYSGADSGGPARADSARREPEILPADWPSPATWGAPLGAGGEILADAPDLVPLGREHQPAPEGSDAGRTAARRRSPRRVPGAPRRTRRPRPRWLRTPSRGTTILAGVVVGLAGFMLLVLFSSSGWAPAPPDAPVAELPVESPPARVDVRDLTIDSKRLALRIREAARERHQAANRHRRDLARRRARERQTAPALVTRPVTRQVAVPSPPASASPVVSPAERALTPGPWNLS